MTEGPALPARFQVLLTATDTVPGEEEAARLAAFLRGWERRGGAATDP